MPAAPNPRKIAFIKRGLFSFSNPRTAEQLRAQFPEYELEEIDVTEEILRPHKAMVAASFLALWQRYGRKIANGVFPWRQCFFRTPYVFHALRRRLRERLAARRSEYAFSFQTQSLYDASLPGLPHFVYTDHAHLANLGYPGFSREQLFAPEWIDLEREIYQNATRVFTMGSHVQRSLAEDYGCEESRVRCVLAGSNVDPTPLPLANNGYANRTIVFVGVEWERKGGPTLVQAFERVLARMPEARLIVVGCRPAVSHPRIEVLGRVSREEVKRQIVRASVLCLPSRLEPFGIAPIEAYAHGLPVVATAIGALPDLVRPGETGTLVPPDDPAALADALHDLLADPEKCRRYGERGRQLVNEQYTWPAVGARLREGILSALSASA